jgi:hypothetical protein
VATDPAWSRVVDQDATEWRTGCKGRENSGCPDYMNEKIFHGPGRNAPLTRPMKSGPENICRTFSFILINHSFQPELKKAILFSLCT